MRGEGRAARSCYTATERGLRVGQPLLWEVAMAQADQVRVGLAEDDLEKVERLAELCRARDGLELPLNLATPRQAELCNQLVCYREGELVGVVTLFGSAEVEISGMVHPDHRRRGVGTALLNAALEECRRREASDVLLICEQSSAAGVAFATAAGGRLRFCEYRMELDLASRAPLERRHPELVLQKAGPADAAELISITARSFDDPADLVQGRIERWLEQPNQHFYLGVLRAEHPNLGAEPIGALRVIFEDQWSAIYTYGRQLLAETVERLLAEGRSQISLEVETENRNALALYQSCGFRETTVYGYYEGLM
jgi:GNAT superfamily N-acetyltransferase